MRKKDYLLFIIIFFSILGIYLLCITNIDIFISDYETKILSYENNFNPEEQYTNIIYSILNENEVEIATFEDLDNITSSNYLLNILSYFFELSKDETINFLEKYTAQKMVNIIYTKYYEAPIIYITSDSYTLIFSLDGKNIYYNKYLSGETCSRFNVSSTNSSINIISNNVNKIMNNIGVKENVGFDITSIRKAYTQEYYEFYGSVYFIEDKTHNIKITYQLDCDVVYILQVGFGELDSN